MAIKSLSDLLTRANAIRTSIAMGAVTPSTVGALNRDMIDSLAGYSELSVLSYGAAPGNAAAVNDTAVAAAVTAALAANATLVWPATTTNVYDVSANIASFHSVRHRGPGAIRRGSDTFRVEPRYSDTNTLYVSPAGGGDGLTSALPLTLAQLFAALPNFGPMLDGTWRIRLAAGTVASASNTISGLKSRNRIEFYGPDVGGHPNVPTAIVDGTSAGTDACGMYFRCGMMVYVKDIKFRNFDPTGNGCGIAADEHSNLSLENVHTTGNANGVDVEVASRLYVKGGIHAGNQLYNIRAYAQCTVTIGYGGSAGANRPSIGSVVNGGGAGILIRDDSSGHVDFTDISNVAGSGGGCQILNQSRVHFVSCNFGGSGANYYNIRCDNQSTYVDSGSTFNAATARSVVEFGYSLDSDSNQLVYFDPATGFFRYGLTTNITPNVPWLWQVSDATISYNSNVVMALEKNGSPYFGFGSSAAGSAGLMFARSGANNQGRFEYFHSNDTFQLRVNAVDSFRWHSTYYRPEVDNTPTLGDATHRWKESYVVTRFYTSTVFDASGSGTPEGVVTAGIGSTFRRTNGGAGTSFYVKESGVGNTGWVAK